MPEDDGVGPQLRRLRQARGFSQESLADRAGVNLKTLCKIERDETSSVRLDTLHKIARALGVHTASLLQPTVGDDVGDRDAADMALLGIRQALMPALGSLRSEDPADLGTLAQQAMTLRSMHDRGSDKAVIRAVPEVISSARSAVEQHTGQQRGRAQELLAMVYRETANGLVQLRQEDLACHAYNLAIDMAEQAGNELLAADCVYLLGWAYMRQRRLEDTERSCIAMADRIEPQSMRRASGAQLAMWGNLLVRASAAAARNNQPETAKEMLAAAAAAAELHDVRPATDPLMTPFGTARVRAMAVERAVVSFDAGEALRLSRDVPANMPGFPPKTRNRHLLDIANAQFIHGKPKPATGILLGLKRTHPEWLKHQRYAADITSHLIGGRSRRLPRDLAGLAEFLNVAA